MATLFLFSLTLIIFMASATGADSQYDDEEVECNTHHKSCEAGFFCYKETSRCAPCIDCATRFRKNHTFGCHQKASDCGECLPGYIEPNLEHDVPKESCMPQEPGVITTSKTSSSSTSGTEYVLNYVAFLSGVSVLSLFLIASFLYRWHKERREAPLPEATELQELMVTQQPPPPYSPFASKSPCDAVVPAVPTAPSPDSSATLQIDTPHNYATSITVEAHRSPLAREREQPLQAVAFTPPNWVNTDHSPDTPQSTGPPSSESSGDGSFSGDIHDDNTQESHWTPNTSQENVEESANQGAQHVPEQPAVAAVEGGEESNDGCRAGQNVRTGRRRASSEDLRSSQESQDGAPREKRIRSESPPQRQTRNFAIFNNNTNINNNQYNHHNATNIQINLNLTRPDDRREDQSPNALVDSEDYIS